jgi:hypothetical protein
MRVAHVIGLGLAAVLISPATPSALAQRDVEGRETITDVLDVIEVQVIVRGPLYVGGDGVISITNHHPFLAAPVRFEAFARSRAPGWEATRQRVTPPGAHVTLGPGESFVQRVYFGGAPYARGILSCRARATFQGDRPAHAFGFDATPFVILPNTCPLCNPRRKGGGTARPIERPSSERDEMRLDALPATPRAPDEPMLPCQPSNAFKRTKP